MQHFASGISRSAHHLPSSQSSVPRHELHCHSVQPQHHRLAVDCWRKFWCTMRLYTIWITPHNEQIHKSNHWRWNAYMFHLNFPQTYIQIEMLHFLPCRCMIRWQIWNEFWQSSRVQMRCARISVRSVRSGNQKACAKASSISWNESVGLRASIATLPQGTYSQ